MPERDKEILSSLIEIVSGLTTADKETMLIVAQSYAAGKASAAGPAAS